MSKNISSRVISYRTVFNYFADLVLSWRVYPLHWRIQRFFRESNFSRRFEGGFDTSDGFKTKPSWRTRMGKVSVIFKDLVLWNHLLLIKVYPPKPLMKLIQYLFSKIVPNFRFENKVEQYTRKNSLHKYV